MRSDEPGLKSTLHSCGERIADFRRGFGLSQYELAELAGLHPNTIANIERGEVDPSVLVANRVFVNLGCPGILVRDDGFEPLRPVSGLPAIPFPNMKTTPACMAMVMGERVRNRRLCLGLSLDEVARSSGLHLNTVWNFERGLVSPALSTTYRLYRALGVSSVLGCEGGIVLS